MKEWTEFLEEEISRARRELNVSRLRNLLSRRLSWLMAVHSNIYPLLDREEQDSLFQQINKTAGELTEDYQ